MLLSTKKCPKSDSSMHLQILPVPCPTGINWFIGGGFAAQSTYTPFLQFYQVICEFKTKLIFTIGCKKEKFTSLLKSKIVQLSL